MKVLLVTQYFWPEYFRVNDLVIELRRKNIEVDILTGYPNYPGGKIYDSFLNNKKNFNNFNGAHIYRVPIFPRGDGGKFSLTLNYLSFLFSGLFFGCFLLRKKKYDNVITFATSPIIVALISIFICKIKKSKHLIWVLDLWPEVLNDLNIISNKSLIYKIFSSIVYLIYKNSDKILCQSLSFKKEILSLNIKFKDKLTFFPSWPEDININLNSLEKNHFDKSYINIVFAGNIGESQNFEFIINFIKKTNNNKIRWYVIGEGRNFTWLKRQKDDYNLNNLYLLGLKKFSDIQSYLSEANFLLISLQYKKTFNSTIPGKFQTYLKYKRPILGFIGGETKYIIKKFRLGLAFEDLNEENFENYVNQIINFKEDNNNLNYEKLLKIYSKDRAIKKLLKIISDLNANSDLKLPLIQDASHINFDKNFIICALNLAFLGYFSSGNLKINKFFKVWPDGFFIKRFFNKEISKIPGRDFFNLIKIDKKIIKRIVVIGNLNDEAKLFLNNKITLKLLHIPLPYGDIENFCKLLPQLKADDFCIITLPTPKQEMLASYISETQSYFKILCLGGAINMLSGQEKPLPEKYKNIFFAEALWRLQYDTSRRIKRLWETFYFYLFGEIFRKFKRIKIFILNEKF
jgi:hypothetical protein